MRITSYSDQGKGKTVVLLHGFCESKEIWSDFEQKLAASYRVINVDLPGFGANVPIQQAVSIEEIAEEVKKILDKLGVRKAALVGHSLGGYVALALAEQYPDLVNGLCLFHSTALADSEEKKIARDKTIAFLEKYGVGAFISDFVALLFYKDSRRALEPEINKIIERAAQITTSTAVEVTKAMRNRKDRTHVLKNANYPVLFIAGKNDEAVPFEKILEQCWLPAKSTAVALDKTGHVGMIERPHETFYAIKGFLEGIL